MEGVHVMGEGGGVRSEGGKGERRVRKREEG